MVNNKRLELVCHRWRELCLMAARNEDKPVWVYVIFRKNHCSGHEKMTVNISFDGPIFWNRQVVYIYCCSCHFHEHEPMPMGKPEKEILPKNFTLTLGFRELTRFQFPLDSRSFEAPRISNNMYSSLQGPLMTLLRKFEHRVERVCIVDKPVDYSFLPDSFFSYMAKNMPRLEFIYLRELDLEKINRGTVVELAQHTALKKFIVHGCRNYEVLQDFKNLPQLLVVKGEIVGLKAMIGELDFDEPESASEASSQGKSKTVSSSESASEEPLSSNSKESSSTQLTAIEVGIQNVGVTD
ncbi:unnamed protein product [Anisakis simplex]|uniref:F-box domain-containing protein n=1 Tax=Anisakis simplex TaxID=6269 RepID=A0A0M3K1B0_ANISI|nr:unnamed protein product [Anisakis simplex]